MLRRGGSQAPPLDDHAAFQDLSVPGETSDDSGDASGRAKGFWK